jgi:hypothetical protein
MSTLDGRLLYPLFKGVFLETDLLEYTARLVQSQHWKDSESLEK